MQPVTNESAMTNNADCDPSDTLLDLDTSGPGGHPAGLSTLFFTELWERFSYYGMRAILMLYMVAPAAEGGLGFRIEQASGIYGTYTMLVYMASIPGGVVADRWLGGRLSVLIGGIIIALGHFTLIFPALPFFYGGLALIIFGTGLLKPNISTMLGSMYRANDHRRDAGFSILYGHKHRGGSLSSGMWLSGSSHGLQAMACLGRLRANEQLALGLRRRRRRHESGAGALSVATEKTGNGRPAPSEKIQTGSGGSGEPE